MKQVIFKCNTCEYRNKVELGIKDYILKETEFESLSDAWQHLKDTISDPYTNTHDIIAFIKEE